MYRHLFVVALCLFFSVRGFERSLFPQRSGDIIVLPETIQDDSFLFLVNSNSLETPKDGVTIEETNVANLISTLVGGPILNPSTTLKESVIPSAHNLFSKNKANLVIFVNSLGSDTLASLPSLKLFQKHGQKMGIQRVAYPQDTIASLTTFMTGHTPSSHGMVNSQWEENNGRVTAYSIDALPIVFNLNDQITQTFEGQPLIIAGSLDFQMASTLAVNPRNKIGNNFALYWNKENARFESIYEDRVRGLNVTASQLRAIFQNNHQSFDLEKEEEFNFLAELGFLQNMVQQLQENENYAIFAQDNIPDLFSFSFASLKALKLKSSPSKFEAAVRLLDETLLEVFEKLSAIYGGKVSLEVLFLGTPAYEKVSGNLKLRSQLFSLLKDNVNKDVYESYFPAIYLKSKSQEICQRVREEIENEVICTDHSVRSRSVQEYYARSVSQTADDATVFQTVLWMSIILFLFATGAVCTMYQMELPADSILYRISAPKQHTS